MSWREQHRQRVLELEAAAAEVMLRALGGILDGLAARFGKIVTAAAGDEAEARSSLDDLSAITGEWHAAVEREVLPWLGGIFHAGAVAAEEQVAALGIAVAAPDPVYLDHAAAQYLAQAAPRLFGLGEETRQLVRAELLAGFRAGEGIGQLRARIRLVTNLSRAKAEALARTEVIGASNMGADARVELMGDNAPPFKQWLATMDARTRPTHMAADGQVVPRGDQFLVGGASLKVPGDPTGPDHEVVNCRCTTLYIDSPEPLDLDGRQVGGPVDIVAEEGLAAAAGPPQVDTTTGEPHTGAMLALIPTPNDAEHLALEGGIPVEQLHLTLWFLGEVADMPPELQQALLAETESRARTFGAVVADPGAFGAAVWNPHGDSSCVVYNVGGGRLRQARDEFHQGVVNAPGNVDGSRPAWEMPEQHQPWVAHICAQYGGDPAVLLPQMVERLGPVTFDRVRLALGEQAFDFELAAPAESDTASRSSTDDVALAVEEATMPWKVQQGGDDCPFEVVNADTGARAPGGCHDTQAEADDHAAAMNANMDEEEAAAAEAADPTRSPAPSGAPEPMPGEHLRAVMHVQGLATGANDTGRVLVNTSYRDTPFAFHWSRSSSAHGGMPEVIHVGNVVRVVPGTAPGEPDYGFVMLDLGSVDGREYARRVVAGFDRWVSVGLDETKAEVTMVWPEPEDDAEDDEIDLAKLFEEPDQVIIDGGRVAELTGVSTPAQADATIEPTPELVALVDLEEVEEEPVAASARSASTIWARHNGIRQRVAWDNSGRYNAVSAAGSDCGCDGSCDGCASPTGADLVQAVTAAAYRIDIPELPPAAWFEEPTDVPMDGALNVDEHGRVWGMLAPLGTGHRAWARSGSRLEAPWGNVDYARFMGGWALTDAGKIPAGPLTMDCGHAPRERANHDVGPAHYDNACSVIGAVAVGESRQLGGVWMAGALLPGTRPDQVARALACRCSGDWQPHPDKPGWSELIACLLVPSPGFGSAHPDQPTTTMREGVLVASSVPVRHIDQGARDRTYTAGRALAASVAGLIDRSGRSPAARVLATSRRVRSPRA